MAAAVDVNECWCHLNLEEWAACHCGAFCQDMVAKLGAIQHGASIRCCGHVQLDSISSQMQLEVLPLK